MSAAARHMNRVAVSGCVLCRHLGWPDTPAEVHHIGDTADRSDWLVVPLCPEHHRGETGYHGMGPKKFERIYRLNEMALLAMTLEQLAR